MNLTKSFTIDVTEDDSPPTVTLLVDQANIAEAGGAATYTATLSAATNLPVTVELGFSGTATLTDDYTQSGVQIAIPAGATIGTVTLTASQDSLVEGNETIVVDIASVTYANEAGTQQATTTIIDDDLASDIIQLLAGETRVTNESGTVFVRHHGNVLFQRPRTEATELHFLGGDGDEILAVGDLGLHNGQAIDLTLDGQGGIDTFRLVEASQTLDLTTLADGALQNVEIIDVVAAVVH